MNKLLKSKRAKFSFLVILLATFLSTSGYSFAKYYTEHKNDENAQLAKFGTVDIDFKTNTVSFNESFSKGWYAFSNEMSIHFTPAEVARKYSIQVKAVAADAPNNDFSTPAYANSKFSLETLSTVYTVTKNNKGDFISTSSNVASTITNGGITSFAANTVYISDAEGQRVEGQPITYNWQAYQASLMSIVTQGILKINSEHAIEPNEEDYHYINFIYFVNITDSANPINYKFIYDLSVEQVM